MNVFNHSILRINEKKVVLNTINFTHLYNDANKSHQAITVGVIGDSSVASIFLNSVLYEGNLHIIDKDNNSISMYPFPSYQTQKDLYVIDSSSVDINDEYNYMAISSLFSMACNIIVLIIAFQHNIDQYNKFFKPFFQIIKQCNKMSVLVLHYNVPPDQCEWEYERSTSALLSRLPFPITTQIEAYLQTFNVIDIPSTIVSPSIISSPIPTLSPFPFSPSSDSFHASLSPQSSDSEDPRVSSSDNDSDSSSLSLDSASSFQSQQNTPSYSRLSRERRYSSLFTHSLQLPLDHPQSPYMNEINTCLSNLIHSCDSIITSRHFISKFYLTCSIYQEKQEISYDAIQRVILTSCHIPTSILQSFFLSLWKACSPNPSVSLSHTHFGNDYYLRIQDRVLLCEYITLLFIASQTPSFYLDAMSSQTSHSFFRDLHKVLHSSILSILPCSSSLYITKSNNPYHIRNVENREYFRHEEQDVIQIPCITPAGLHDQHTSVYTLDYQSWFHIKHGVFHWKGDYHPASIRHLDRFEYRDVVGLFSQYKASDRLIPLIKIQSLCSSSRQKIIICMEKDLPESKNNCSICPFCVYCWKELSFPKQKRRSLVVSNDDGVFYSQKEGRGVCEDIYLVQCEKCCGISADCHFHARSYPYSVDGVPALFLPSLQPFHLCPLCFHLISKKTVEENSPPEGFSISPSSSSQKQEQRERMLSLLDYMNRTVGGV